MDGVILLVAVPYNPLKMFRAMILLGCHSLSAPEMKQALKVRMDFIRFTDFDVVGDVPDETTICRFRRRLINRKLDKRLFAELNRQLPERNIMVKAAKAAIVDASVIESAARPKQTVEDIPGDRREEETESPVVKQSADPDATWLKKGKQSYPGYKLFAIVDEDGFCRHTDMTPANRSEVSYFEHVVRDMPRRRGIYSDKGNASQVNRGLLRELGLYTRLLATVH